MKIDQRMADRIILVLDFHKWDISHLADRLCYPMKANPFWALFAEPFQEFTIQRTIHALATALEVPNYVDLHGTLADLQFKLEARQAEQLLVTMTAAQKPRSYFYRVFRRVFGRAA